MNFSGQPCARLNADTPLFEQQIWNRSILFQVVNVFLLGSPNEHAVRLQRVWVDGIIILPRWKSFIDRLTAELDRYPIFVSRPLALCTESLWVAVYSDACREHQFPRCSRCYHCRFARKSDPDHHLLFGGFNNRLYRILLCHVKCVQESGTCEC